VSVPVLAVLCLVWCCVSAIFFLCFFFLVSGDRTALLSLCLVTPFEFRFGVGWLPFCAFSFGALFFRCLPEQNRPDCGPSLDWRPRDGIRREKHWRVVVVLSV